MAIGSVYVAVVQAAAERGVDVGAVLSAFGLTRAELADPGTRLSPEVGRALGRELFRLAGDPEIGLRAAALFELSALDLVGYLARHAGELQDALEIIGRYSRLLGDTAACAVVRRAGVIELSFGRTGGRSYLPEASEFFVGIIARLVREVFPRVPPPAEVRLVRARPRNAAMFRRFFAAPVTFGAAVAALAYPESAAHIRSAAADLRLGEILRRQADGALAALPADGTLCERLRAHLAAHLEVGDDVQHSAARLHMSERTLRRRLRESGTGYRELLDAVRRERALALVDAGVHSVTAIASRVGFADASAFARAFRRWTGKLPHDYVRATQLGER